MMMIVVVTQLRGGSRPSDKGEGGGLKKNYFLALRASVWSKNKGGGQATQAPPLNPPL